MTRRSPGGRPYRLSHGDLSAVVTEVGATLRRLTRGGRELIRGYGADEILPSYSGAVLAPWPNRIADGAYRFAGQDLQLPLTEPTRSNALHGLVVWERWTDVTVEPDRVVLGHSLIPRTGYPFELDLTVEYRLDDDGLHWTVTATNVGAGPAPYGTAPHPYLVAAPGRVDGWTLDLPASSYLDVTADRLLPTTVRDVAGGSFDFRGGAAIGDTEIDHAFTGVTADDDGRARVTLLGPDGSGVQMTWDPATCPWVQIHTADKPDPAVSRTGLAVEPMTCPPNAFVTGTDLVHLAPGGTHRATWTISALG